MADSQNIALFTGSLRNGEDVVRARQCARLIGALLGFDVQGQTRIATAVSEISRNAFEYGNGGKIEYFLMSNTTRKKPFLAIRVSDKGPGIANVTALLTENPNKAKSILGVKRIMNRFAITSKLKEGCVVWMEIDILAHDKITPPLIAHVTAELARYSQSSNLLDEIKQQNRELINALELIQRSSEELEAKINERTQTLQLKNKELEAEIQQRSKAEKTLETVTQQLHLALKSAKMGTWQLNTTRNHIILDHYLTRLFGLEQNSMPFETFLKVACITKKAHIEQAITQAISNAQGVDIEFDIKLKNDSLRYLAWRGEMYFDSLHQHHYLLGIGWDITERKQAQLVLLKHRDELSKLSRASSLGEMGSAIAHELNQPLTAITNFTTGCLHRLENNIDEKEEIIQAMKIVAEQAERAGAIIHRLKELVRKGAISEEKIRINARIEHAIHLLQYESNLPLPNIELALAKNLPLTIADPLQIEQVLMNLMKNAIESMNEANTPHPCLKISSSLQGKSFVNVKIIDNGPGVNKDIEEKIMQPHFTTKITGMGMGLSISRTIIEGYGGRLLINEMPTGACFEFVLPTVEKKHE